MGPLPVKNPIDVIVAALPPLDGARILDIGCGRGALAKALSVQGAQVVGVDPDPAAVVEAQREAPEGVYILARAETLPFRDASFDGAAFQNSLHHVAVPVMQTALRAALQAVRAGRPLVVMEPLTAGSLFEMVKSIEDETDVRAAAQNAVETITSDSSIHLVQHDTFLRLSTFRSFEAALATIVGVDPSRALVARRNEDDLRDHFFRLAVRTESGFRLEQPMRTYVLKRHSSDGRAH